MKKLLQKLFPPKDINYGKPRNMEELFLKLNVSETAYKALSETRFVYKNN